MDGWTNHVQETLRKQERLERAQRQGALALPLPLPSAFGLDIDQGARLGLGCSLSVPGEQLDQGVLTPLRM